LDDPPLKEIMQQSINQAMVTRRTSAFNQTLNAAFTGAVDTAICRFNAAGTLVGAITETTTGDEGTRVLITSPGIYHVEFSCTVLGAVPIAAGISLGAATVAAITADPVVGVANVIESQDVVSIAVLQFQVSLSAIVTVTGAAVSLGAGTGAGTAGIMFHLTDSGGAAPVGVPAASAQYRIEKLFESNL
jgi:hypothetical protein